MTMTSFCLFSDVCGLECTTIKKREHMETIIQRVSFPLFIELKSWWIKDGFGSTVLILERLLTGFFPSPIQISFPRISQNICSGDMNSFPQYLHHSNLFNSIFVYSNISQLKSQIGKRKGHNWIWWVSGYFQNSCVTRGREWIHIVRKIVGHS